jgi:hypothetical protein
MSRRCGRWVISSCKCKGVAISGNKAGFSAILQHQVLSAKAVHRVEAIMIHLFKIRFFRQIVGIVLMWRITRPATLLCIKLAYQEPASPSLVVLTENMKYLPVRFGFRRANINRFHIILTDEKRFKLPVIFATSHSDFDICIGFNSYG